MRQCPTLPGDELPLIAHSIENGVCAQRQREFYHKCHRCVFSGKPMDFVPEPESESPRHNGVVRPLEVELETNTRADDTAGDVVHDSTDVRADDMAGDTAEVESPKPRQVR